MTSTLTPIAPEETTPKPKTPQRRAVKRKFSLFELLSLGLAVVISLVFLVPIFNTVFGAVVVDGHFSFDGVFSALSGRDLPRILLNTVVVVVGSGIVAVVVGTAFAWLNERTDARLGLLGSLLPLVPLLLPPVALSIGWYVLAQEATGYLNIMLRAMMPWLHEGPLNINSWAGLIWVYSLYLVPFAYLTVSAAFRDLGPGLEEASRISGAGRWRTLTRVSLPAVRPAIGSAFLLVALSSLALYSIPTVIGTGARIEVLSVHIVNLIRQTYPARLYEGVVLSVIMMLMLLAVWSLQQRMSRGNHFARIGGKTGQVSLVALGPWKWVARAGMIGYLFAASLLPFGALLFLSFTPYWSAKITWGQLSLSNFVTLLGSNVNARAALQTSVTLAFFGATIGIGIAAIIMTQAHAIGGRVRKFLDFVTKSPGAVSHIIIGVAFLVTYSGAPFFLYGTAAILLLAYVVTYLPQASVQASTAIQQIGPELMEASSMSGASRSRTFWKVTFPLMLPGLMAGWAMIFVLIVGDLTVSALLAGTRNPVVGFVILNIWENGNLTQLAALAVIICIISGTITGGVLLWARSYGRRRKRTVTRRGAAA